MSHQFPYSPEFQEWESTSSRRESTVSTSTVSSASTSILFQSPATSPGTSSRKQSWQLYDDVVRLQLNPHMSISFVKSGQQFKLRYTYIDVCKDSTGALKCLELGGGLGQQAPFIHAFHNTKLPVPHIEHPKDSEQYPLRISFLDQQTVQTAHVVFMTQLSYKFENWEDCVQFQELLLCSKLVFLGGMAEAKSKGRGEECISQNLRVLRGHNGKRVMLYFANSQRGALKRYVSIPRESSLCSSMSTFHLPRLSRCWNTPIPRRVYRTSPMIPLQLKEILPFHFRNLYLKPATVNCVGSVKPPKKAGRPVIIELNPNFEILSQMRNLQITFLNDDDCKSFCQLLSTDLTIG